MNNVDELIPGLPDFLALDCLLRLPFHALSDARGVCKRWKYELDSPSFYRIRKAAGFAPPIVALLLLGPHPPTLDRWHLLLYEPDTGVVTMRQLAPNRPDVNGSFNAMVVGRELVMMERWDGLENRRTGEVHIYDLLTGAWRSGAPNPALLRPWCRYGWNRGKVVVVGGRDHAEGNRLRSALAYDVASDTWLEIPDVGEDACQETTTSIDEKFWESREEYNSTIGWCKKLLDDEDEASDMLIRSEYKKTVVCVSNEKKGEEKVMVPQTILREDVLKTLKLRLGLFRHEIFLYIKSYFRGWL